MSAAVLLVSGGLCAVAAAGLTPLARRIAETPSRWLASRVHIPLAALGGAGAAALATDTVELIAYTLLALGAALLTVIDLAVFRLPNVLVGPLYGVIGLLLAWGLVSGEGGRAARAAAAAGILVVVYFVLGLIRPGQLGLGDVKLAGVIGGFLGWLGWSQLVNGSLAAFVCGAVVAAILLVSGVSRRSSFPYGPMMILGAAAGAALG